MINGNGKLIRKSTFILWLLEGLCVCVCVCWNGCWESYRITCILNGLHSVRINASPLMTPHCWHVTMYAVCCFWYPGTFVPPSAVCRKWEQQSSKRQYYIIQAATTTNTFNVLYNSIYTYRLVSEMSAKKKLLHLNFDRQTLRAWMLTHCLHWSYWPSCYFQQHMDIYRCSSFIAFFF